MLKLISQTTGNTELHVQAYWCISVNSIAPAKKKNILIKTNPECPFDDIALALISYYGGPLCQPYNGYVQGVCERAPIIRYVAFILTAKGICQ